MSVQRSAVRHFTGSTHPTWPLLVAVSTFAVVAGLLAEPWYQLVRRILPVDNVVLANLQFASWLLLLALAGWWWRRDPLGLRLGSTVQQLPTLLGIGAAVAAVTGGVVWLTGANAWSDAHWTFEVVLVPLSEELLFRGVVLGLLLTVLQERRDPATARRLAVWYSAIAFGLAHVANALEVDPLFVAGQVLFATVLGLVLGSVRLRTGSLYPAIALHAIVNAVNLLA